MRKEEVKGQEGLSADTCTVACVNTRLLEKYNIIILSNVIFMRVFPIHLTTLPVPLLPSSFSYLISNYLLVVLEFASVIAVPNYSLSQLYGTHQDHPCLEN